MLLSRPGRQESRPRPTRPHPTLQLSFAVEPDSELEAEILGADVAVEDKDPLATEDSAMGALFPHHCQFGRW